MKKSQLKEAIKNEIKSILSEDRNPKIYEISSTEANAQLMEIVEHQKQILNILKELKKGDAVFAIKGADLNAAIKLITNEVGKTLTKVKNLEQIKGLQTTFADIREDRNKQLVGLELVQFLMDRFNMSEDEALKSLADNIGNVKHEEKDKIRESEEMTDTEMNAKAEKEAKEADKKAKKEEKELKLKVDKIKSILKKNKTDISRIAKLPRNKRTKADDEMFDSMVSKTKELKKLEKDLK